MKFCHQKFFLSKSNFSRLLLFILCSVQTATAGNSNYCPISVDTVLLNLGNFTVGSKIINPTGQGNITLNYGCTTQVHDNGIFLPDTFTLHCGATAPCGGHLQLECVNTNITPIGCDATGVGEFPERFTVLCDDAENQVNNEISPLSINLPPNITLDSCLNCGGVTSALSCNNNVCNAGFTHSSTNSLNGSISQCAVPGVTWDTNNLFLVNKYGLCAPTLVTDFSRAAHEPWPISDTPSTEKNTVLLIHGRGAKCGSSMGNLLDSPNGMLATNNLVYCVEYAQGDDGEDGARNVAILEPIDADGENTPCLIDRIESNCNFDQNNPVHLEVADEYSVQGVGKALFQALQRIPLVGEVSLIGHSQGGFIERELMHNYYDDLRYRGIKISRVTTLAHPYFGREFDPGKYAAFQCIDQPNSFDCQTGTWLWGWQDHLANDSAPFSIDNDDFPQVQWNAIATQGEVGGVSSESQPESCTSIFGGVLSSTVLGDGSVPIESALGRDEFNFFVVGELNIGMRIQIDQPASHNAQNLYNYIQINHPENGIPLITYENENKSVLEFDENGGAVAYPTAANFNITDQLTLEAWIKPTKANQTSVFVGHDGRYYLALINGVLRFALNDSVTGWVSVPTKFTPPVNEWSHVAMTYDDAGNTGVQVYFNGHQQIFNANSGAIGTFNQNHTEFRIGNRESSNNAATFEGLIDDVRIWSGFRTSAQIRAGMKLITPSASLLGWWKFDEQDGNALLDSSGNNFTIGLDSVDEALAPLRMSELEIHNGAKYFDGIDDALVVIEDWPELNMENTLTIEAWIYPRGPGGAAGGVILNKEGEYALARSRTGFITWSLANSSPGWSTQTTNILAPENEWTHIALTYSGSGVAIYKNGQLAYLLGANGPIGDRHPENVQLHIGNRELTGNNQPFHGVIDDVRLWNVIRDIREIQNNMLGIDPSTPGLVGLWKMDEQNRGVAFSSATATSIHATVGTNGSSLVQWPADSWAPALPIPPHLDSDKDGIPDDYENNTGVYVNDSMTGTDPNNQDTDGDGLLDGDEIYGVFSNPLDTDFDGDGVIDSLDNCIEVENPNQRDTDGDLFGNFCDADLDNSGLVNAVDLAIFRSVFFTTDAGADFDGNGIVNAGDLAIFRSLFFQPPGPSGLNPP